MLKIDEIKYKLVTKENFIRELENYPDGEASFDYETINLRETDLALDTWDEDTHPFMFSLSLNSAPEDHLKCFVFDYLTEDQQACLKKFLYSRRVWVFNCKYEGSMTWKEYGYFFKFDDVQPLYKIDGMIYESLKSGTKYYLKIPQWSDAAWKSLETLKAIMKYLGTEWFKKWEKYNEKNSKKEPNIRPLAKLLVEGNIEGCFKYIKNTDEKEVKAGELKIINLLFEAKINNYLKPIDILSAIKKCDFDHNKVNLKTVNQDIVARYCVYDSYATSYNKNLLWERCKEQYYIYLHQSYLSTVMSAYSCKRDLVRDEELEKFYKEKCLYYYKELFKIPYFRVRSMNEDDYIKLQGETDYYEAKYKYWNPCSNAKDSVNSLWDSLYTSSKFLKAMIAYHVYKYCLVFEDMVVPVECIKNENTYTAIYKGIEITNPYKDDEKTVPESMSLISFLKWNTLEIVLKDILTWVNNWKDEGYNDLKEDNSDSLESEASKRNKLLWGLKRNIKEARDIKNLTYKDKQTKVEKFVVDSLASEHIENMYNAYTVCADGNPDQSLDKMDWEFKIIFCFRLVKKMEKSLSTYIYGNKVGRGLLQNCEYGKKLTDVPIRKLNGSDKLFQVELNPNSVITKRWAGGLHTLSFNSELREMFIPRRNDSLVVHYDYCWHKDTKIKLLSGKIETIESLYLKNSVDKVYSYNPEKQDLTIGTIKEVRKVKKENTLLKITFDNNYSILLTKEHNIFKRGYLKVQAKDLKLGDSILSLFSKIDGWYAGGGYEMYVISENVKTNYPKPYSNKWKPTHKNISVEAGIWTKKGMYVHHIDECKLNNDPSNLEEISPSVHTTIHLTKYYKENKQKISNMRKEVWKRPEYKEKMTEKVKGQWINNREQMLKATKRGGAVYTALYNSDPIYIEKRKAGYRARSKRICKEVFKLLASKNYTLLDIQKFKNKQKIFDERIKELLNASRLPKGYGYRSILNNFNTFDDFINEYRYLISNDNHIIINIEEVKYNDWVYTIEIAENHHNYFVIASDDEKEMILSSNSQAEIRVIAKLAGETNLLNQFYENPKTDVHRIVASGIFKKDPKDITVTERHFSKSAVFAILYGKGINSFAIDFLHGDIIAAKKIFSDFFSAYPNIKTWCDIQHKKVIENRYVKTLFGDKLPIEFDNTWEGSISEAKRCSINYPTQSSSSSLAATGIWDTWELCQKIGLEAIPNGFTHDSSDWEVLIKHLVYFIRVVRKAAVEDLREKYGIPMKIDFEIGVNQNGMMSIIDPIFRKNYCEFNFECSDLFFNEIINRLKLEWNIEYVIESEKVKRESMAELFMPKRAYSMYIGQEIKYFEGTIKMSLRK